LLKYLAGQYVSRQIIMGRTTLLFITEFAQGQPEIDAALDYEQLNQFVNKQ
jgi:hypothetical protein